MRRKTGPATGRPLCSSLKTDTAVTQNSITGAVFYQTIPVERLPMNSECQCCEFILDDRGDGKGLSHPVGRVRECDLAVVLPLVSVPGGLQYDQMAVRCRV